MSEQVDLLIVRPTDRDRIFRGLGQSISAIEPPIWSAVLAAFVRQEGFSVAVIDVEALALSPANAADLACDYSPLLVAYTVTGTNLSASTWHMTGARDYITAFNNKNTKSKTILWGLHPSALPEKTLREESVDFVCQGEGFTTLVELLKSLKAPNVTGFNNVPGLWYLENEKNCSNSRAALIDNLDELSTPAWDLLPMERYRAHNWHCMHDLASRQPYGVIYTSLGCPFDCSFCSLKALFGKPGVRFRSPQRVIEDIDVLVQDYGVRNIKILDECFVLRKTHVMEICDLIIERGYDLNIWAYARVDTVNEKILSKLKQAGFNWLCYGIETADENVRGSVSKGGYNIDDIQKTVDMTHGAGIHIIANFMFGLPDDSFDSMRRTLDLAKHLNCEYTNFCATKAYPGSDLYVQALNDGLKLPQTWRGYSEFSEDSLPLPTKHLSGEEVLCFRDNAWTEFHSDPHYLEMVEQKFGHEAVQHLREVIQHKPQRAYSK